MNRIINFYIIFNITGFLLMILGVFMLAGIPFSIWYGSDDIPALLISFAITSGCGALLYLLTKTRIGAREIRHREGYMVVTVAWVAVTIFGTLPFLISGAIPNPADAYFETVSGFTTTGASILDNIESVPHGVLFWRSISHWLGGMGIIVLSLAILPLLGVGGMQLYAAEVTGPTKDKIHPRIQETAKRLWGIYLLLNIVLTILYLIGGMNLFDALSHSFSTVATGGFSTKQASIGHYDSLYIESVTILFMILGGTNFALHYYSITKRRLEYHKNEEFRLYAAVLLLLTLAVTLIVWRATGDSIPHSLRQGGFQVVSIMTTTGYATSDFEAWGGASVLLFLAIFFLGGCGGSTTGSIKMIRYLVLFKNSLLEVKRLIHPRAIIPVRMNQKVVHPDIIRNILAFFVLYIFTYAIFSLSLTLIGIDPLSAIGAVGATLGGVGPGLGEVGPSSTFASLPDSGKWLLSLAMLMGRLELFTLFVILSPPFWRH